MQRKKYFKIIIISAAIISIITAGAVFLISNETLSAKQGKYTMGNTSSNIVNNGFVAQGRDYIYYSNTSDDNKLYRMKDDGSNKKKISDDSCSYINIIDEWIYYRNDDDCGKIYKIKTDGTTKTCLNNDTSSFVTAVGDSIYYCNSSDNNQIIRIKSDGSDRKVICKDSAEFMNISDGWIYYSNTNKNHSLYKIRVNGKKRTLISKDMCYSLNVFGDWIYYINYSDGFKLYKIKINGHSNTVLDNALVDSVNACGNWIYFYAKDMDYGGYSVYRIKPNGTCKQSIFNGLCQSINTSSNWIFYINAYDKNFLYRAKPDGTMRQCNDGTTVVRSISDLSTALMAKSTFEIKDDKVTKVYQKAKEIIKGLIKPGMTDLEKELILHDYVITHTKYDIDSYNKKKLTYDNIGAYGVLVNGVAVCGGYAEAMQLLLNLSGIECLWVEGMAGEPNGYGRHAWNIVKIDGEYYHLDATWDDQVPDMGNHVNLMYFNLSDDVIKNDHKWEKDYYKTCTSDRFAHLRKIYLYQYQNGWIYYNSVSDGKKLYKMRVDGSSKEKLSNDCAYYIVVDGKYIYFSNYSKKENLYRIDINGKNEKQLNNENCKMIEIENNVLKYINGNGILKTMKIR